jgi:hypothetical protein
VKGGKRKQRARLRNATTKAEIGLLGRALRGLGGLGGAAIGGAFGAPAVGGAVGSSFGAAVSRWLGAGDYSIAKNSIVSKASASIPSMHRTDQSVIIRHREYIGPIKGSTAFTIRRELPINPGLEATFPWMSGIAKNFQEFEVKGMVYHYIPTSGSAISSTSSALGSVMFQTTYRSTDTAPVNKIEMLNEYWSNEVVPFESTVHPIECSPKENPFAVHYVRVGEPIGEPLMFDIGKTFIATQGMQSEYVVGDLWVTYEIELKKPIVSSNVTSLGTTYYGQFPLPTRYNFFLSPPTYTGGSLGLTFSSRRIIFPVGATGVYIITLHLGSADGVSHATTVDFTGALVYTGCSPATVLDGTNSTSGTLIALTGGTTLCHDLYYVAGISIEDPSLTPSVFYPEPVYDSGTLNTVGVNVTQVNP